MDLRSYDPDRDFAAVCRIFREAGWLPSDDEGAALLLGGLWQTGHCHVALAEAEAECFVATGAGSLRYLTEDLSFSGVLSVVTSRVARRQGLASRLTAHAVATEAEVGSVVCGLGMFEQGYYNRLGFGSGAYEHWVSCDPAGLLVPERSRPPRRLGPEQWEQVHAARLARRRTHGSVVFAAPQQTRLALGPPRRASGLGYFDNPDGTLSHYLWFETDNPEHGPYRVTHMAWSSRAQFRELLGLLGSLGDQVHLVEMKEPAGVQLQDLLRQPMKSMNVTEGGKYEAYLSALAYQQFRMLDLPACLAQTHLSGGPVRFSLRLHDPIEAWLEDRHGWRGVGGEYVVTLGEESSVRPGVDPALPRLEATVGAFTRMWLGVRPATGLAVTDDLHGPDKLLAALDEVLRLPEPKPDWDF